MKTWRVGLFFMIFALISGVYFREMTKLFAFDNSTMLSGLHVHALVLGTGICLLLVILDSLFDLFSSRYFPIIWRFYLFGLMMFLGLGALRGTLEVTGQSLTSVQDHLISGFAGLSHIVLGSGMVMLMMLIGKAIAAKEKTRVDDQYGT